MSVVIGLVSGFAQRVEGIRKVLASCKIGRKDIDFPQLTNSCSNFVSMSILLLKSYMRLLTQVKLLASVNICSQRKGIALGKYSSYKQP